MQATITPNPIDRLELNIHRRHGFLKRVLEDLLPTSTPAGQKQINLLITEAKSRADEVTRLLNQRFTLVNALLLMKQFGSAGDGSMLAQVKTIDEQLAAASADLENGIGPVSYRLAMKSAYSIQNTNTNTNTASVNANVGIAPVAKMVADPVTTDLNLNFDFGINYNMLDTNMWTGDFDALMADFTTTDTSFLPTSSLHTITTTSPPTEPTPLNLQTGFAANANAAADTTSLFGSSPTTPIQKPPVFSPLTPRFTPRFPSRVCKVAKKSRNTASASPSGVCRSKRLAKK